MSFGIITFACAFHIIYAVKIVLEILLCWNRIKNKIMFDPCIRPINLHTDLNGLADLLYYSFSDARDADGERYIAYLRRISQTALFSDIAKRKPEKYSLPGEGFVYEEGGRILGNITLSSIELRKESIYLISNVAVNPDQRGRGIARKLTQTALQYIESQGVKQIWLQVKQENQSAISLYEKFDFKTFMTRTTWVGEKRQTFLQQQNNSSIRRRTQSDWEEQKKQFEVLYPRELTCSFGFELESMKPSLMTTLRDFIHNTISRHWVLEKRGKRGFISYNMYPYQAYTNLWLAAPEDLMEESIHRLVPFAHRRIGLEIRLNLPAEIGAQACTDIGLTSLNTLLWQRKSLA